MDNLTLEQQAALAEALTVRPCHVTGMHTPNHHLDYLCQIQKAAMFDAVLEAVGLSVEELPHALHEDCYWCHNVPAQEQYRARLRRTYEWAGVPVTGELAELADDAPRPGDQQAVAEMLTRDGWHSFADLKDALGWPVERLGAALHALEDAGMVERLVNGSGKVRLT